MTTGIFCNVEQNTPEWDDLRLPRVTASEIYEALHAPERALRRHIEKRLGIKPFYGNAATRYGHEAEPVAIEHFENRFDVNIELVGFVIDANSIDRGCSPDALIKTDTQVMPLQVKCPYSKPVPEYAEEQHLCQLNYEMGVIGATEGMLYYWTPNFAKVFSSVIDDDLWQRQCKAAAELIADAHVILNNDPIAWLAEQDPLPLLREDDEWEEAADKFRTLKRLFEDAEAALKEAREQLVELSEKTPTEGCGVYVAWRKRKGNVQWKALAKAKQIPEEEIEKFRGRSVEYAVVEAE